MEVRRDNRCFVCGVDNPEGLGLRFVLEPELRRARCRLRLPQRFQGWEGLAHGGILATLLDETAIYACRCEGDQFVTAGIAVRYRKPVPVGEEVEVTATVTARRRRLYQVHSELRVAGVVHAEAEVEVVALDPPQPASGKDVS